MDKITKTMSKSVIVNVLLAIVKIIAGSLGKSSALVADGIHSFSDLATDLFVIVGNKFTRKPADKKHPFGHGKLEYIMCIVIGIVVIILGITIITSSINRKIVVPSLLVLIISLFTIIIKYILSNYILKKGKKYNSSVLVASGLESKMDVISSVIVLFSIAFAQLGKYNHIFVYSDLIASIIIGLLIIRTGFRISFDNLSKIIGEQVNDKEYLKKINKIIQIDGVIKVDKLIILKYGPYLKLITEISMDQNEKLIDVHNKQEEIEENIKNFDKNINYVIIHVNPYCKND